MMNDHNPVARLLAGLGCLILLQPVNSPAIDRPDDWVEGTQALDGGATRDFYNRGAQLPWRNFMGDWDDINGVAQGDAAFASVSMIDDDVDEYIEWDVTGLVQSWLDGDFPNLGMLLRNTSSGATYRFYSREHPVAVERPELVVTTASGTTVLPPHADTYIASSTFQGFGDDTEIQLSSDTRHLLISFDLGSLPAEPVLSADLRLFVQAEFGNGNIGVFRASQGHSEPPSSPVQGLAAQYPADAGIENHPSVMLFESFGSASWGQQWSYGTGDSTLDRVLTDPGNLFQPFQDYALRARVPDGGLTGLNVGYRFEDELGFEPEEIYFRYYLRIGDDWDPLVGGKLPGIAGRYPGTSMEGGWGGRQSNGMNGWSSRGLYRVEPPPGNTFSGHLPTGNYVYHADMPSSFGDNELWQNDHRGLLEKNRWYCIEMYLQLNSLTQNDGIMRGWIDGRLAWEKIDYRWRDIDALKIQEIWLNVYHGGTTAADQDMHVYLDNIVIATEYIGPTATGLVFSDGFED